MGWRRRILSTEDRLAEIQYRAIPSYWDGVLLRRASESHIATLVERSSRFVTLVKVDGKDSDSTLIARVQHLPQGVMASLTSDRGIELAYRRKHSVATAVSIYFCDPTSPLRRDRDENPAGCCTNISQPVQTYLFTLNTTLIRPPCA